MQLLSSLICLIVLSVHLADATSLRTHNGKRVSRRGGVASGGSSGTQSVDLVHTRRLEAVGSITRLVSPKDVQWGSEVPGSQLHRLKHLSASGESATTVLVHRSQRRIGKYAGPLLAVAVLITCLSFVCACFGSWWDEDQKKGPDPTMAALDFYTSPWAIAYQDSEGQQREAIELLFKCNIVTMPEFANDYAVSRQHSDIHKCISIAVRMLQEHSTSDWEGRWQEAQQDFEEKAAEMAKRWDERGNGPKDGSPREPQ